MTAKGREQETERADAGAGSAAAQNSGKEKAEGDETWKGGARDRKIRKDRPGHLLFLFLFFSLARAASRGCATFKKSANEIRH